MIFLVLLGEILAGIFVGIFSFRFTMEKTAKLYTGTDGKIAVKFYLQLKPKLTLMSIISITIMYLIFVFGMCQDYYSLIFLIFLVISIAYIFRGILILNKFDKDPSKIVKNRNLSKNFLFSVIFFFQNIGLEIFSICIAKFWLKK